MRLTIFNGSPRGINSNSKVYLDFFLKGFISTGKNSYEIFYLKKTKEIENQCMQFHKSKKVIIAFPLYFDSMPAIVKRFFETIEVNQYKPEKQVGFLIQAGFPESNHFKYIEKYLHKMTRRINCNYQGSIIRGGGEGIRVKEIIHKPIHKIVHFIGRISNIGEVGYFLNNNRTLRLLYKLGQHYGKYEEFNTAILTRLSGPCKLTKFGFLLYKLIGEKMYFNLLLEKNNAFDKRNYQPYSINIG